MFFHSNIGCTNASQCYVIVCCLSYYTFHEVQSLVKRVLLRFIPSLSSMPNNLWNWYRVPLLSFLWVWQLLCSQLADSGFLCDKAAVVNEFIDGRPCTLHHLRCTQKLHDMNSCNCMKCIMLDTLNIASIWFQEDWGSDPFGRFTILGFVCMHHGRSGAVLWNVFNWHEMIVNVRYAV